MLLYLVNPSPSRAGDEGVLVANDESFEQSDVFCVFVHASDASLKVVASKAVAEAVALPGLLCSTR